jgi:hypothetical protein
VLLVKGAKPSPNLQPTLEFTLNLARQLSKLCNLSQEICLKEGDLQVHTFTIRDSRNILLNHSDSLSTDREVAGGDRAFGFKQSHG